MNASRRRVNKNSLIWWYILKTSWRHLCKTSLRCLEDVLKTSWRRMIKTNIIVLIKTTWRLLKTSSEHKDERRLQDVFIKTNVCWVPLKSVTWDFRYSSPLKDRHIFIWQPPKILNVFFTSTLKQVFWKTKPFLKNWSTFFSWKCYYEKRHISIQSGPFKRQC